MFHVDAIMLCLSFFTDPKIYVTSYIWKLYFLNIRTTNSQSFFATFPVFLVSTNLEVGTFGTEAYENDLQTTELTMHILAQIKDKLLDQIFRFSPNVVPHILHAAGHLFDVMIPPLEYNIN